MKKRVLSLTLALVMLVSLLPAAALAAAGETSAQPEWGVSDEGDGEPTEPVEPGPVEPDPTESPDPVPTEDPDPTPTQSPDPTPTQSPDPPIVVPKSELTRDMFEVDTADVTYTGQRQEPAVKALHGNQSNSALKDIVPVLNQDYTVAYTDNVNAGTATITITGKGEHYFDSSVLTYTFKITPKPLAITGASVADKTYDGKTDANVTAVTFDSGLTKEDYTATAAFASAKVGQGKAVTVTVTLKNKNYSLAVKTFQTTASIVRATLPTLQAAAVLKETAGSTAAVELSALPLPKGEAFTFTVASSSNVTAGVNGETLTLTTPDSVSGSKAAVTVSGESENYTVAVNVAVTYTDKTPVTLSGVKVDSKTYNGNAAAYTGKLTVTDRETNTTVSVDAAAVKYEWFAASNMGSALTGAPTDAGDYVLLVTVDTSKVVTTPDPEPGPDPEEPTPPETPDGGGEELPALQSDEAQYYGILTLPFTISKAVVTVKADAKSVKVNAALPAFTYTVTGLVGTDKPDDIWQTRPVALSPEADASKAGSYKITVTPGVLKADFAKNYEVKYADGTLTVSRSSGGGGGGGGGSSSGGSSGSSTQYAVSVPKQPDNGKVTLSAEKGKSGSTVTLTVAPDKGYKLDKLTVTDKNGKVLTLTDKGDGKFTFVMPSSKVEISAAFVKEKKKAETAAVTSAEPITKRFNDIKETNWYRDAVQYVYDRGMMNGMTPKNFEPAASASRAMLVTILYRMEGEPKTGEANFSDVADWMYYADSVAWAAEKGIATGHEDGSFQPDSEVTREQIVSMLYRYARLKGYDTSLGDRNTSFVDGAEINEYAREAVRWAASIGLVNGYQDGSFRPSGKAARAEVAAILMRFCEGVAKTGD